MIAHCPLAPPVHVPHLLPFHIQYSGPGPLSIYLHIQPVTLPESRPCFPQSAAVDTQPGSASTTVAILEENEKVPVVSTVVTATAEIKAETDLDTEEHSLQPLRPGSIERLSGTAKIFISSFCGRTVHGVEVPLPKGHSELVLRGDAEGRTKTTTSSKAKRRPCRMLRRQVPEDDDIHFAA